MLKTIVARRNAGPVLTTFAVLLGAAAPLNSLVRNVSPNGSAIATLKFPALYTVFAPVSDILDTLTLFSPRQYWSTFGLAAFILIGTELFRRRRAAPRARALGVCRSALRLVGGTAAAVGLIVVLPRPMASLSLTDPDLVAVDFHSHTSASHDGRTGFDAERNRTWHASAGFDVAYITDHQTFAGALEGTSHNPQVTGAGTVLLPGVELRNKGEHVLLIGADPLRTVMPTPEFGDARISAASSSIPSLLILPMPANARHAPAKISMGLKLGGIEVSDGCPRGLAQTSSDAGIIASMRKNLGLASVSGSDNHGWGRTAAAWSVVRIRGWRAMSPVQIDDAIRASILGLGPRAVEVVARRRAATPTSPVGVALGGVSAIVVMLRTLTWPERASWISWIWILWFAARLSRDSRPESAVGHGVRRRTRPQLDAAAMELA